MGSSGTTLALTGIANAFANANNLVTLSTGMALATTPAGNGTVPQAEINTLGNALASCVNSNGLLAGPTNATACYTLFTSALAGGTTGMQPTDTASAAINIAHYPGTNVPGLYGLAVATPPFSPGLMSEPNDFSVILLFGSTGGVGNPAVDGLGNVWMLPVNGRSAVFEFSPAGAPLSPSAGYTAGGVTDPQAIAIDVNGNVWIANSVNNPYQQEPQRHGTLRFRHCPLSPARGLHVKRGSPSAIWHCF